MPTNGQKLMAVEERYLGVAEIRGLNDGPLIDKWQALAEDAYRSDYPRKGTLDAAAWCAIFVYACRTEAKVDLDLGLTHPYTGYICRAADRLGGLRPAAGPIPTGAIIVKCGVHVEAVLRDRRNGYLDTIGGNVGNRVAAMLRDVNDWRVIAWPGIGAGFESATRIGFGFDDLLIKPDTFGGWADEDRRDAIMTEYASNNPGRWAAAVTLADRQAPHAFRAGFRGTYGKTWRFGPWFAEADRDAKYREYVRANGRDASEVDRWYRRYPTTFGDGQVARPDDTSTT